MIGGLGVSGFVIGSPIQSAPGLGTVRFRSGKIDRAAATKLEMEGWRLLVLRLCYDEDVIS